MFDGNEAEVSNIAGEVQFSNIEINSVNSENPTDPFIGSENNTMRYGYGHHGFVERSV